MKKLSLLSIVIMLLSCSKSKEEQMIYDYVSNQMQESLKVNINDLDFKFKKVEKTKKIKSSDSLNFYKNDFKEWAFKGIEVNIDTVDIKKMITQRDTLINSYQKIIIGYIELGKAYKNYQFKKERNKAIDDRDKLKFYLKAFDKYDNSDFLSQEYKATYTILNPLLNNTKQTHTKLFYSNKENSEIIKSMEL